MRNLMLSTLLTTLMLTAFSNSYANISQKYLINNDELKEFYIHLANRIKYPSKAQQENLQGNSMILFSVINGKLKDLKVEHEVGNGFDTEVLNNILSFSNFNKIEDGKYALETRFVLDGSKSTILNENATMPTGYIPLKIFITALPPVNEDKTGKQNKMTVEPLIILDGKIIKTGLSSISPESIDSINVLKGFSATSLYGDEGKNGVLIIISKKLIDRKNTLQKANQ